LIETLAARVHLEPFNAVATTIFVLAVLHTFAAAPFAALAHRVQVGHDAHARATRRPATPSGGRSIIANAPNPAGQALRNKFFGGTISLGLALGALLPTLAAAAIFRLFQAPLSPAGAPTPLQIASGSILPTGVGTSLHTRLLGPSRCYGRG
jgi:hypothetical protein